MTTQKDYIRYLRQISADLIETAEFLAVITPRRKRKNCARAIAALKIRSAPLSELARMLEPTEIEGAQDGNS